MAAFTVRMAIASCSVNDVTLWNGQTKAQRIAFDMFHDAYTTCMDKTMEEVETDFKSYAELPLNQKQDTGVYTMVKRPSTIRT